MFRFIHSEKSKSRTKPMIKVWLFSKLHVPLYQRDIYSEKWKLLFSNIICSNGKWKSIQLIVFDTFIRKSRYIYIYKDRIKRKERTSGDVEGRERVHVCFVFGDSARTEGDESARGSETSARFNAAVP